MKLLDGKRNREYNLISRYKVQIKETETEEQLQNVLRSEICRRYWKAYSYRGEFRDSENRATENEKFYNDLVKFGITRLNEGAGGYIKAEKVDFNMAPNKWK